MNPANDYTYESSGFDGFLSRSIDNLSRTNLESSGPTSTNIRYDSSQMSGRLGDTLQVGNIRINKTNITISDGGTDFLLMGEDI